MTCKLCADNAPREMILNEWVHPVGDSFVPCGEQDVSRAVARRNAPTSSFDLVAHIYRQRAFSLKTFGPGPRTQGVIDHIRKELGEIEKAPADLSEWVDVILLAIDGAHRAGYAPEAIAAGIDAKQTKNEKRQCAPPIPARLSNTLEQRKAHDAPAR